MCDITSEFIKCVNQNKLSTNSLSINNITKKSDVPKSRSAFTNAASEIARGVSRTSDVLSRLTKLVKRQGLFDDPTEEINNLILRVKQDLDELNTKCDSAQQYVDNKRSSLGQSSSSHNTKVVSQLKTGLMNATSNFKSVLELRSSKMKDQQIRKVELTGNGTLSPMKQFNASINTQQKQKQDFNANNDGKSENNPLLSPYNNFDSNINNNNNNNNQITTYGNSFNQQQLLLQPPTSAQYFETREAAVTEVEKTIGELGVLFKRLSTMIMEQQEFVERIDDDIESSIEQSNRAHGLLMKTYEQVSSNKTLYTKIFSILAAFILFFVLFLM
jgi:syntaxin 5